MKPCVSCHETGIYQVISWPEDYDWESCDCGTPIIENAEREYFNRVPEPLDYSPEPF